MASGKVLVLGWDTRSFLAVVRSLGRAGLKVHVAECPTHFPARSSRYIAASHELPEFRPAASKQWLDALTTLCAQEQFDLIVPTNDQSIIPFQKYRESIGLPVAIVDEDVYAITNDKIRSWELAARLGISVPKSVTLDDEKAISSIPSQLAFPVVVKPTSSFDERDLSSKNFVWWAADYHSFADRARAGVTESPLLVQEFFAGTGMGVEVLAAEGEILVAFQHERLHEPLRGGGSTYRRSVALDEALLAATGKLVAALKYTGVGMFEYRFNKSSGSWIFVEINSRFWGSLPLAIAAGANFPYYLYQLLVNNIRSFPQNYRQGIYARNLITDLRWIYENLRANKNDPLLLTKKNGDVIKEFLNLFLGRERWDTFVLDDPRPFLSELRDYLAKLVNRLRLLFISTYYSIPLVRRLAHKSLSARFKRARRVLFVCKGNICRSPFAEAYAVKRFGESKSFSSAGFLTPSGRGSPKQALTSARLFGVSLLGHSSKVISNELVAEADLILVFDHENRTCLKSYCRGRDSRIFYLGVCSRTGPLFIPDPFGGDPEDFDRSYSQIATCLSELSG